MLTAKEISEIEAIKGSAMALVLRCDKLLPKNLPVKPLSERRNKVLAESNARAAKRYSKSTIKTAK